LIVCAIFRDGLPASFLNQRSLNVRIKNIRNLLCLVVACFAVAGAPVQAGTWTSDFDPIGMSGTDFIRIGGSNCLPGTTAGGFFYVNGFGSNNCTATLLSANITLTSMPETSETAHLIFTDQGNSIWGVLLAADGTLLGVDSFLVGPQFATGFFTGPWWIQLDDGTGQTPPSSFLSAADPPLFNTVHLFTADCSDCAPFSEPSFTAIVDRNQFRLVADVPEPGTLGLLLGALAAGWLARRRKTAP
jgi:hypothetical protein